MNRNQRRKIERVILKKDRVSKDRLVLNLKEFAELFPSILLDTDFQRYYRWKSKRGDDYWKSVMVGLGNIEIKVVSIDKALEYAKEVEDDESLQYFYEAKRKGYKYVSLDGNSRSTWNALFVLGFSPKILKSIKGQQSSIMDEKYDLSVEWNPNNFKGYPWWQTIVSMTRRDKKGNTSYPKFALYEISSESNIAKAGLVKYNGTTKVKLDDVDAKNLIQMFTDVTSMVKFEVEVWEKITKPEMHEMFVNFNLNEAINNQDHRNAWNVDMSYLVRNFPTEIIKVIESNVKESEVLARGHHEMIGFCQMYKDNRTTLETKGTKLTSGELDKYWKDSKRKNGRSLDPFETKVWNSFTKLASTQNRILESRAFFLDLFLISLWLGENNISTSIIDSYGDDPSEGWEQLMGLHTDWMEHQHNRGSVYKVSKGEGDWNAYRGGISYFTYSSSLDDNEWSKSLWSYLDNELIRQCNDDNAFLVQREKRVNVNTSTIRTILWKRQNGICPLTGKTIPFSDILNTGRKDGGYEVDHIKALDKGGTNDIENLQLVDAVENAKKSNKDLEMSK